MSEPSQSRLQYNFSIVELLSIIGIICLLATLLLSAFYGSVTRSRLAACSNNLRVIGNAIQFYSRDNSNMIPNVMPGMEFSSVSILRLPNSRIMALGRLTENSYLPGIEILGCPDSPGYNGSSIKRNWVNHQNIVWSSYLYRSQASGFNPRYNSPDNANKVLVVDFACPNISGKQFAPHNYQHSNLLYGDNHVECRVNTPKPFEFYTVQTKSYNGIIPDCTILWQHCDQ